jgi:hypothetical protein
VNYNYDHYTIIQYDYHSCRLVSSCLLLRMCHCNCLLIFFKYIIIGLFKCYFYCYSALLLLFSKRLLLFMIIIIIIIFITITIVIIIIIIIIHHYYPNKLFGSGRRSSGAGSNRYPSLGHAKYAKKEACS